jgi:hypothetical protein
MMSSARGFLSSYVLSVDGRSVGFTIRSTIVDDKRDARLIGFDLKPDFVKYYKFIKVVGDTNNKGIILPDVNMLVNVDDFVCGQFCGIVTRKEMRLRKHSVAQRNGKDITMFTLERVSMARPDDKNIGYYFHTFFC